MVEDESNLNVLDSFPTRGNNRIHGLADATRIKGLSLINPMALASWKCPLRYI